MKVEIKKDGQMNITAENELEAYALKKWVEDYSTRLVESILFTWDIKN